MKKAYLILVMFWAANAFVLAQVKGPYIHSHNDYLQEQPLIGALNAGAESIEIDVFLHHDQLIVAHTKREINAENTLEKLYLLPLQNYLAKHQSVHQFHLMIDIKSEPLATLSKVEQELSSYPHLFSKDGVKVIISGNRPPQHSYNSYSKFILFDARDASYVPAEGGKRIAMISQNLSKFTRWRGAGEIPEKDKAAIVSFVKACHAVHKPVRFWNTGEDKKLIDFLLEQKVDYINTDHPRALRKYLNQKKGNQ